MKVNELYRHLPHAGAKQSAYTRIIQTPDSSYIFLTQKHTYEYRYSIRKRTWSTLQFVLAQVALYVGRLAFYPQVNQSRSLQAPVMCQLSEQRLSLEVPVNYGEDVKQNQIWLYRQPLIWVRFLSTVKQITENYLVIVILAQNISLSLALLISQRVCTTRIA